ncbi:MAG: sigma-70 family RNA polymerase sigma factor [Bacteroidota bacterium]
MTVNQVAPQSLNINTRFIKEYNRPDVGNWQYDVLNQKLFWSGRQFEIYGYKPGSVRIEPDYFISRTTHYTEVERINAIIEKAMLSGNDYNFRRRIIKGDGRIGFVETQAQIFRSPAGEVTKIIGLTIDLGNEEAERKLEYNDPLYFNTLYKDYKKSIYNEIYQFVYDERIAEDLCQEVFVKAWNNIWMYDPQKGKIYTWLINISRNHCKDYLRSKCHKNNKDNVSLHDCSYKFSNDVHDDYHSAELKDVLKKLPAALAEVTQLLFIQGYTQEEVARLLHIPLGTVKTRSRQAILYLRTSLALN